MSLSTLAIGQKWDNSATKTSIFIEEFGDSVREEFPQYVVYRTTKGTGRMSLSKLLRLYTLDKQHKIDTPYTQGAPTPSKEFQDVLKFHQKFGLLHHTTPGHLSKRKLKERIDFLQEELDEFIDASGIYPPGVLSPGAEITPYGSQDLSKQADALVDLVYVAIGTAVMLGLPWDCLWDDVQRANMAKERGITHRGHAVDVKKPKGWVGPKGSEILESFGYNPNEWERSVTNPLLPLGNIKEERDDPSI
jgi:predicted HAD superfamily Cof-like phosphohydrolase